MFERWSKPEETRKTHGFTLEDVELEYMEPCPECKNTDSLRIIQGFGARVFCWKCGLTSPWISGFCFEQERRDGISEWNRECKAYPQ